MRGVSQFLGMCEVRPTPDRIETWSAIGAYIGRDARTAQRYEARAGLPVRRLPGGSTVYALRADLDAWMRADAGASAAATSPSAAPVDPPAGAVRAAGRAVAWRWRFSAAAAALLVASALWIAPRALRAPVRTAFDVAEARRLTDEGEYAWNRRTREGIATAVDRFTQALVHDPQFAPAYAGLANAYDLAPEFVGTSPEEAYPRARAAAARALTLDPRSAAAHRALAFETFWWERDAGRAEREFRIAIATDPRSAVTHLWYANVLGAQRDERALKEIDQAVRLDPDLTAARADKGWIEYMLGRPRAALETLRLVAAADGTYSAVYRYRALAEAAVGDDVAMLRDMRREGELTNNGALTRIAAAGLAVAGDGRPAIRAAICREAERAFADGAFPPDRLASLQMLAGHTPRVLELLRIIKANRRWYLSVISDPVFAPVRAKV